MSREPHMIRAVQFLDQDDHRRKKMPGSLYFEVVAEGAVIRTLWFYPPCGCDEMLEISIGDRNQPGAEGCYHFNGNMFAPTISQYIRHECGLVCQLRDGYWQAT